MKNIIKKWWFLLILIVLIIAILYFYYSSVNKGVGSAGISLEEFKKIELGMGETTVSKIVDTNDEWFDDDVYEKCCKEINKSKENHIYRYTYKYIGEKSGYALITFEADYSNGELFVLPIVSKKEQHNLK